MLAAKSPAPLHQTRRVDDVQAPQRRLSALGRTDSVRRQDLRECATDP
jgi:hypothetical protein